MSQASRGGSSNNNPRSSQAGTNRRPNVVHTSQLLLLQQQRSSHKPNANPGLGQAAATTTTANSHVINSISSRPQQRQQHHQLLLTTASCSNGPVGSISTSSNHNNNNRLATLANVSVAAAAAAHKGRQQANHLSIANAPTSLANLARLSGITLLPIGTGGGGHDSKAASATNLTIDPNNHAHRQSQSNGGGRAGNQIRPANNSSASNKPFIQISRSQEATMTLSTNSTSSRLEKPSPHANNQWRVQKTSDLLTQHDLEAVPSVRLLNQASNMDSANLWLRTGSIGDKALAGPKSRQQASAALPASTTTTLTAASSNNNRAIKKVRRNLPSQPVTTNNSNNVNQSFVPDNRFSSFFNSVRPYPSPQQPSNTSGMSHNNTSMTRSFENSNTDQDLNNSSLMKLMAILNNPALTITAVNNSSSGSNSYSMDSNVSSNYNSATKNNHQDRNNQPSSFTLNLTNRQQTKTSNTQPEPMLGPDQIQSQSSTKSRVPQSATNLQLLFKTSSSQLTDKNQRLSQSTSQANSLNSKSNTTVNSSANANSNPFRTNWSDKDAVNHHNSNQSNSIANNGMASQSKTSLSVVANNVAPNAGNEIHSRTAHVPTVSVQLLKHIANQARDDESQWMVEHDPDAVGRAALEPECIITNARSLLPFALEAKYVEIDSRVQVSSARKRRPKTIYTTSKRRLFIPNEAESSVNAQDSLEDLQIVIINEPRGRELCVSEQHQILSTMMADRDPSKFNDKTNVNGIPEPDDIFINRPKKVMSKIDTMLERKKRKRFDRISGRSEPKTSSIEEQCEESEAEWSEDDEDLHDKLGFVTVQLPLDDEELSSSKREHLNCLGLVTRYERQKISLQNLERRMNRITPLALEGPPEVSEDLKRMVDTVVKTDGRDIQMRIDSSIKRNDLPLIEGLSRNTSKVKMSYMSILGLEKRSKRTTLYKLKNVDGTSYNASSEKELDLNNRAIYPNINQRASTYNTYYSQPIRSNIIATNDLQDQTGTNSRSQPNVRQLSQQQEKHVYLNCRDVVKPNKDEYMKSLGLMAS